jgi:hypothetical protein
MSIYLRTPQEQEEKLDTFALFAKLLSDPASVQAQIAAMQSAAEAHRNAEADAKAAAASAADAHQRALEAQAKADDRHAAADTRVKALNQREADILKGEGDLARRLQSMADAVASHEKSKTETEEFFKVKGAALEAQHAAAMDMIQKRDAEVTQRLDIRQAALDKGHAELDIAIKDATADRLTATSLKAEAQKLRDEAAADRAKMKAALEAMGG